MLIIVPDIDKEQILHLLCVQYYACWPTFLLFQQWHMGILQFTEELEHPLRLLQAGKQVRKDRSVFCSFADLGLGDMCYIVFCSFPYQELGLCATLYYGLPGVGCYVLPCILLLCWPGVRCYVLHCIIADPNGCYVLHCIIADPSWVLCVTLYYGNSCIFLPPSTPPPPPLFPPLSSRQGLTV